MLCRYVLPFVALPDVQAFAQSCSSSRQVVKRLGNVGLLRLAQVRPGRRSIGTTPLIQLPPACSSELGYSICHSSTPFQWCSEASTPRILEWKASPFMQSMPLARLGSVNLVCSRQEVLVLVICRDGRGNAWYCTGMCNTSG